ncbi:MAG: ATPase AAA-2 domain protein [Candidatus Falkowbacteria bacterium GW2011_GWF2_43_32]|nr:MAG: ATPase AAA-2 domain protein [Candidatus Falkowbacteria bacterium GW2011_GWF2_43_32]
MSSEKLTFTEEQNVGGRGVWFLGRFLFWGRPFKKTLIGLARASRKINFFLSFLRWLIIFAGWAAFGYWLFLHQALWIENPVRLLFFWRTPDILIFIFLFSLWFDLFSVYESSQTKAAVKKIKRSDFDREGDKKKKLRRGGKKYEVANAYAPETWRAVEDAYLLAARLRQTETSVIHLFRVLLKDKKIQNLFIRLDADVKKLVELVDRHLLSPEKTEFKGRSALSPVLQEVLVLAFVNAYELRQDSVDVLNVVSFCAGKDPVLREILYELEIDEDKINNTVAWFRVNRRLAESYRSYSRSALLKPGNNMNRSYTAIATPTLDHFSHDLTVRAKYGDLNICVGRKREISSIFEAFSGGHNGVLLVGPVGVGKSAIIDGLAQLMVEENVPDFFKDRRLVELDVSRLLAGAAPAEAQERLLLSLNEVSRSGNIILYIDNIENLIGISGGAEESLDISEVLAEAIGRRNLYCLAAATTENYARYIENKAIGNVMTTVAVKEPETNEAIQILESKVGLLESKYDIYIVYGALEAAVTMSDRYLHDKFLPFKALDLLEKAAIITGKNARNNPEKSFCGREEVAAAISEITGIPASKASLSEGQKLLNLEDEIHQRLVDQEEAVRAVAASLRRARAEMKDSKRPIASFLFLGPTGVGKTELAKSVSQVYFGDEDYLIRLDMSEYQDTGSVRKMIGDVDGTLGYLIEAVRKKPFSLILLDEIEKANPDILNLFLQLLDDGRLTDGQGRTISFAESIIIATSNIGAVYIQEQIVVKTPLNVIKQGLIDQELNKYLRPELINRFDGIIVFKPLSEEDVFAIATLMLKKIKKNLAAKGIGLKADKDGVTILAHEGYDPKFGARPLRRLLQDRVENPIANKILAGELKRRDTIVINNRAEIEVDQGKEL